MKSAIQEKHSLTVRIQTEFLSKTANVPTENLLWPQSGNEEIWPSKKYDEETFKTLLNKLQLILLNS